MASVIPAPFEAGDRITERYGWPQHGRDGDSAVKRFGHVVDCRPSLPNGKGEHGWLISVRWDGESFVSHGYTGATLVRVVPAATVRSQVHELNLITQREIDNENRRLLGRLSETVPSPTINDRFLMPPILLPGVK